MAESKNNVLTHGLSGMIGDMIVFRQRGGKTFVSNAPKESTKQPTPDQQQARRRFQQATIYGKAATSDPTTKTMYEAAALPGQNAYNVAVADFFHAPDIAEIDLSRYQGKPGNTIRVRVTDDFAVKTVHVKIENGDHSLVEEGNAVADPNGLDYIFTATKNNASLAGDKITVSATDTPDNLSIKATSLV